MKKKKGGKRHKWHIIHIIVLKADINSFGSIVTHYKWWCPKVYNMGIELNWNIPKRDKDNNMWFVRIIGNIYKIILVKPPVL